MNSKLKKQLYDKNFIDKFSIPLIIAILAAVVAMLCCIDVGGKPLMHLITEFYAK